LLPLTPSNRKWEKGRMEEIQGEEIPFLQDEVEKFI